MGKLGVAPVGVNGAGLLQCVCACSTRVLRGQRGVCCVRWKEAGYLRLGLDGSRFEPRDVGFRRACRFVFFVVNQRASLVGMRLVPVTGRPIAGIEQEVRIVEGHVRRVGGRLDEKKGISNE